LLIGSKIEAEKVLQKNELQMTQKRNRDMMMKLFNTERKLIEKIYFHEKYKWGKVSFLLSHFNDIYLS
jgi:hypothetical protein